MRNIYFPQDRYNALRIVRAVEFLLVILFFAVLISVLFYFFNSGAVIVAESVIDVSPPEPW